MPSSRLTEHLLNDYLLLPVCNVPGIGPKSAQRLQQAGIATIGDLLLMLPLRYQDRTEVTPIAACRPPLETQVQGRIVQQRIIPGRKRMLLVRIADDSGELRLRFFHFFENQKKALQTGGTVLCYGTVRAGKNGLEMVHPSVQVLRDDETPALAPTLTPVYSQRGELTALQYQKWIKYALEKAAGCSDPEWLPEALLQRLNLRSGFFKSLQDLHTPSNAEDPALLTARDHPACRRLAFEEMLAHHCHLRQSRKRYRRYPAHALDANGDWRDRLRRQLPFRLTPAQQKAVDEISADLTQPVPMLRMLQGDVGSGKTVVAAFALLQALACQKQAVLMAPTEILAEQHYRTLSAWLQPLGVETVLLTGQSADKSNVKKALAQGRCGLCVGTHALFQSDVVFADLALAVIDEQHRFGVRQRLRLLAKGTRSMPHQLVMTATPIPRSLAMTAYADLDYSVIDGMPPGRKPVTTVVIPETRRAEVIARIKEAANSGRQVYWICTLIEDSDISQAAAAESTLQQLRAELPQIPIDVVHGRMKARDKSRALAGFSNGQCAILVATTVIEVGVDVPGASLMIIENAERLGLAQLHQLRGRVGRGAQQSVCVLMYKAPLSEIAKQRLQTMRDHSDGFRIAEADLKLRGPGELLGQRQTGALALRVADMAAHLDMLPEVIHYAASLHQREDMAERLSRRWLGDDCNERQIYAQV